MRSAGLANVQRKQARSRTQSRAMCAFRPAIGNSARSQRRRFWTAPRRSVCRQALKHKFGTHSIIISVVEEVRIREAIDPLLYLDGQFVSAKALASATVDRA
jgi:predicted NAD-dependent protein-ADP-ribosyltransferase YbiA (DUF1768 family)